MSKNIREQLFLTVYEEAEVMNMGKSKCYDYINSPDCPFSVVKVGMLKRIPSNSFFQWYDSLKYLWDFPKVYLVSPGQICRRCPKQRFLTGYWKP